MVRVASALGERLGADALVTGDSLGQVASQTLPNLAVVEEAAQLPLLRPLIDRDKSEIVERPRTLGTYEISILPDEDCCQLFSSKLGVTRGQTRTTCARSSARPTSRRSWTAGRVGRAHHPRLEERAMVSSSPDISARDSTLCRVLYRCLSTCSKPLRRGGALRTPRWSTGFSPDSTLTTSTS